MTYSSQTAWITGASSGIGEALAIGLAKRGARLVLSGRNVAELERVAAACGGKALVLPFETTDYAALPGLVAKAWEWGDGVDLLAPIALTQALLPLMVARKRGRLAFISSVAGKVGVPMRTAYSAAKFGLFGYADALRAELSVHNIAVHGIAPGSIRTNVSRNALTSDGSKRGFSDPAIEKGIDPEAAAAEMLDAMLAGQREIVVAQGVEKQMGELTRTPDALFDQVADLMAQGYAQQLKTEQ